MSGKPITPAEAWRTDEGVIGPRQEIVLRSGCASSLLDNLCTAVASATLAAARERVEGLKRDQFYNIYARQWDYAIDAALATLTASSHADPVTPEPETTT